MYDITTMLNKASFIKSMHMPASVRDPCRIQITPQHNSFFKLATAIRYLIYKQYILTSQICSCVAKRNSTVKVIITPKIYNGHNYTQSNFESFMPGDRIILAATKSGSIYEM